MTPTLFAFLASKFSEPSTHRGLAALLGVAGLGGSTWLGLNPDVVSGLYTVAGIYFGAVEIIRSERSK